MTIDSDFVELITAAYPLFSASFEALSELIQFCQEDEYQICRACSQDSKPITEGRGGYCTIFGPSTLTLRLHFSLLQDSEVDALVKELEEEKAAVDAARRGRQSLS